jgi:ParB family chromosome partitioning protein
MAGLNKARGLDSLFSSNTIESKPTTDKLEIDINKISPNQNQPRTIFDEESLNELATSIKHVGILQPLNVRKNGEFYEIIAGERRWRAARIAGLKTVPVVINDFDELTTLQAALIENIQREDLNPIEEAYTYKRLADEFKLSQEEISKKVGKSRSTVANAMRLVNLDSRVQGFVKDNKLSNGHARTLLGLDNKDKQFEIAELIIEEGLNVRQTEDLVKRANEPIEVPKESTTVISHNPELARACLNIAKDLKSILGTKVSIKNGKNKGKIEIEYYSPEELDRIVGLIKRNQ